MPTAAERAVFVLDVDARNAEAGMNRIRGQAAQAGAAFNAGGGGVKFFQERVEKAATAVTGMSSVLGGMGSQAGASFGAISNLASAFVVGGPLLAGIAAATTAAAALYARYNEADEAAKKLAETQRRQSAEAMDLVRRRANSAAEALRNFGKTATQISLDENRRLQGQAQGVIAGGSNAERAMRAAMRAAGIREDMSPAEAFKKITSSDVIAGQFGIAGQVFVTLYKSSQKATAQMGLAKQQLVELKKEERDLLALLEKQADARRVGRSAGGRGGPRGLGGLAEGEEMSLDIADTQEFREAYDLALSRHEQFEQDLEALASSLADFETESKKQSERAKLEAAKAAINEEAAYRKQMTADALMFAESATMQAANLGLSMLEAGVRGQFQDIGTLVTQFVKGMGQQIMGIGIKYMFEGAGMIAASKGTDPGGWATLGVGAAAFVTGGAMAATGTVVGAMSMGKGGGAGRSFGGGGAGSVGTVGSRGGGGQSSGGGQESITIIFNGGTHLGDSTERARTMARDQRRASRNIWVPGGP